MQEMIRDLAQQHSKFREMAADVREMLGFDLCMVWRLDKKERRFYVAAWHGTLDEAYRQTIFLDAETIQSDESIQKGVPIYISDVTDPQKAADYLYRQEAKERGWTSAIRVPLVHKKRVIGIIDSYTYQPFKFLFNEHKRVIMSSLRAFANQAAESIRNIDLSNRLETVQDINQVLTGTFDEKAIVRQILVKGMELVGADLGHIYLMDINLGYLVLKESIGIPDELVEHKRELGQGLTGYVAKTGVAENIPDVSKDARHTPILGVPINSKVAVPLRREEQTIGVLSVKSRFYNAFTDDDVNLLITLATQATIAIERARLNQHLQQISRLALGEDYTALLNYVVNAVRDLTLADVSLWMIGGREEARGQYLQIVESSGDIGQDYIKNAQLPMDSNISINVFALREKRAIIRPDIQNDSEKPQFYQIEQAIERGWHSFMAVPLIGQEGEPLGVLSLYSKEIAKFGPPEIELMQPFANQVAIALQQQRKALKLKSLANISQRQANELEALHQTTLKITAQENLHSLLQALVEEATKLLKGKGGKVYLKHPNKNDIELVAAKNVDPAFLRVGETFPSGEGMTGKVLESKEPLIIDNYAEWSERIERVAHLFSAMIEAPLLLDEQAIGVISVFTDESEFKFTDQDIPILKRLAQQAALAIRNASFFEESKKKFESQINALGEIARSIAASNKLEYILKGLLDAARSLMGEASLANIRLLDKKTNDLVVEGVSAPDEPNIGDRLKRLPINEYSITGWVAKYRTVQRIADVTKDKRYQSTLQGMRSELTVPMLKGDELIGVLNIEHPEVNAFTDKDVQLAEAIAGLTVVAIENHRLFEQLTDRATRLELLQMVTATISAEPSDLMQVLRLVVDSLSQIFAGSPCAIRLYDTEKDEFTHQVAQTTAVPEEQTLKTPRSNGISRYVLKTKAPYYVEDSDYIPPRGTPTIRKTMVDQGIRAMGALPLKSENEVIGVLYLQLKNPHQFTKNDKQILELFANQAVVAIKNAQLYEQIQAKSDAEIKAIREIATSIAIDAPIGRDEALSKIMKSMVSLMGKSALFNVWFLNQNTNALELVAYEGQIDINRYPFNINSIYSIPGWVARHKQSELVPDVRQDERYIPGFVGGRSKLAVPMLKGDELIGVLSIEHPKVNAFTESDVQLAEAIASLAVVAMENHQLLEQLEGQVEQLKELDKRKSEFLSMVSHELRTPLTPIKSFLEGLSKGRYDLNTPKGQNRLKIALKSVNNEARLVENLLDLVRVQDGGVELDLRLTNIAKLITDVIQQFKATTGKKRISLRSSFSKEDNLIARVDKEKLRQVISNLVDNAIKFSPSGGIVTVSARSENGEIKIQVSDTGVGIPEEKQSQIFERFYQVDHSLNRKVKGAGIGLHLVKKFVELHGGKIWVESELGQGATFTFTLPQNGKGKNNE